MLTWLHGEPYHVWIFLPGKFIWNSLPRTSLGNGSHKHPLLMDQNSRLPEGKQVFGIKHIVWFRYSESLLISSGNCGNHPKSDFPGASQGLALQIGFSKESRIFLMLTLFCTLIMYFLSFKNNYIVFLLLTVRLRMKYRISLWFFLALEYIPVGTYGQSTEFSNSPLLLVILPLWYAVRLVCFNLFWNFRDFPPCFNLI